MLIEKRSNETGSVFILNDTLALFDETPKSDRHWVNDEWRRGSYATIEAARHALQSGTPTASALAAYEARRPVSLSDTHKLRNIRRRAVFSDTGDEVDASRLLGGDSNPWRRMARPAKTKSITVGMMLWMSCGNKEGDFVRLTCQTLAIVEALQSAGYVVSVLGVHTAQMGIRQGFTHPLVKAGQPVDEHALLAWGQPAACRHIGFCWMHRLYNCDEMGRSETIPDDWLALAGVDVLVSTPWIDGTQQEQMSQVLANIENKHA
jgi:hypothetical protein